MFLPPAASAATRWLFALALVGALTASRFQAAEPLRYQFSFPEPEHRWMQVDATFTDLDSAPLELRMSRSSPGRYSLHEFAKNVYDVRAYGPDGGELAADRPDADGWTVRSHPSTVTVRYKVYGDRDDGTYLAVDTTHAHINMPAVIMWARGLEDRPATLTFEPPRGAAWQVATQLHPAASDGRTFTAPNLPYLIDSPVEFGPVTIETFMVGPRTFRFAAHHTGSAEELRSFVSDVAKIVRQEGAVFGEFPPYEPGTYTFLADYLPYASYDGMEHRNSTVMTSPGSIATARFDLLDTVAHEFFHSWNVERIRPRDIEPFDLERANTSADLWLAEGFTQYYGPLMLQRSGVVPLGTTARQLSTLVDTVVAEPGRSIRSAEEMSRMSVFSDGAQPIDRTNWSISVISYYPFGGAIALALDLSLRERSGGRVSLDDFMREMWRRYGAPGGVVEGVVDRPYTTADAEGVLAAVGGDAAFAHEFFARYVQGHDVADYAALLAPAGFTVRPETRGAWLGDVRLGAGRDGVAVVDLVAPAWPLYAAGVDQDDEIERLDGTRVTSAADVDAVLRKHRPGDRLEIVFLPRGGTLKTAAVTLRDNPHVEVIPIELAGGSPTASQLAFRERWLGPK